MLKNEVGIFHNVSPEDYFRLGVVREDGSLIERGSSEYVMSRSELRAFAKCPRAWKLGIPRKESKAFDWGNLMDVLVLTPELESNLLAIQPETYCNRPEEGSFVRTTLYEEKTGETWNPRTKACREWKADQEAQGNAVYTPKQLADLCEEKPWNANADFCKEWLAGIPRGKTVIASALYAEGQKALKRVHEDQALSNILAKSQTQTVVVWDWTCPITGVKVRCKAMLDVVPPAHPDGGILLDYKTSRDAEPRAWVKSVANHGYHYQGAMYTDGYNTAASALGLDDERTRFGHLIQESSAPYETVKRLLTDEWLEAGRSEYEADLMHYVWCRELGDWHGYVAGDEFDIVDCPQWVTGNAEAKYRIEQDLAMSAHSELEGGAV